MIIANHHLNIVGRVERILRDDALQRRLQKAGPIEGWYTNGQ
jgi:hypothetical protein